MPSPEHQVARRHSFSQHGQQPECDARGKVNEEYARLKLLNEGKKV
jgi:hypothetical protein